MARYRIESIRRMKPDWCVARVVRVEDGARLSLVGDLEDWSPGTVVEASGAEGVHPTYGPQLRVGSAVPILDDGGTNAERERAVRGYLDRLPEIGPARARALLQLYGEAELMRLLDGPESAALTALQRVNGITPDRARRALAGHRRCRNRRTALVELTTFGLSAALIEEAVALWEDRAVSVLTEDPFALLDLEGGTLVLAEGIAARLGFTADDVRWQRGRIRWTLRERERDGHTWTPAAFFPLHDLASEVFQHPAIEVDVAHGLVGGPAARAERAVAAWLRAALAVPVDAAEASPERIAEVWPHGTPHPDQVRALELAARSRVMCLTGGPGRGKTATVQALVSLLQEEVDVVELLAPTGKAACRVTELSGLPAQTIHMLLAVSARDGGPQDGVSRLVIIDETSMVSVELLDRLLRLLPVEDTRLVFVGDPDQLPSIGPGRVLADLLDAVPTVRLTHIFRQANESRIPYFARDINELRVPNPLDVPESDLRFIYAPTSTVARDTAVAVACDLIPASRGIPSEKVRIIAAMRSRGDASVDALNAAMQRRRATPGAAFVELRKGEYACVGEPVMHTKNNYQLGVMNGEQGTLVAVNNNDITVEYDDKTIVYSKDERRELVLSYAVTGHKCLDPETLIETDLGIHPIASAKMRGRVYTPDGWRTYTNHVRRPDGPRITITTKAGYTVTVTPDHGLDAWTGTAYTRVEARDLQKGQFLRLRLGRDSAGAEYSSPVLPPAPTGIDVRARHWRIPTRMTPLLAEFLGAMVADGTVFRRGFRYVKRQRDVVERFAYLVERLFGPRVEVNAKRYANAFMVEVLSVELAQWLLSFDGLRPRAKATPPAILAASPEIQARFLRGLFEDATVNVKRGRVDHIEFSSVYPKLRRQVQLMLLRLGVVACCGRRTSSLYIYSEEFIRTFAVEIGFMSAAKRARLRLPKYKSKAKVPIDRGTVRRSSLEPTDPRLSWYHDPIVSLEADFGPSECLTVPAGARFLQNGFAGWNCQGSSFPAVVVVLDRSQSLLLTRGWIYTAVTRAERLAVLVGQPDAVAQALRNLRDDQRTTNLARLVREGRL